MTESAKHDKIESPEGADIGGICPTCGYPKVTHHKFCVSCGEFLGGGHGLYENWEVWQSPHVGLQGVKGESR